MTFDRRQFLKSITATMGLTAASQITFLAPAFASVSPASLAADPRRPQFHLLPAANWMNDPNGPIYWNGSYHMFYQYNPNGAFWGDMHWGHAVSADMVHWKHLPVALAPTPGGPDADGCFSGTAVVKDGVVNFLYTGVVSAPENQATIRDGAHSLLETQCLAVAQDPELKTWKKLPAPVIATPPPGMQVSGFRDPSPWRQGDQWYMVIGSGLRRQGGAVLLYRSHDLVHWDYLHLLTRGNLEPATAAKAAVAGDMWECPEFFPLGNKHVLIYSSDGKVFWESGEFDTTALVFHREHHGVFDYGSFYAAKTQKDKSGNRILWGWVPETRPLEEYKASGWAGMMSLPRVLTLNGDGQVAMSVAPEVLALRQQKQTLNLASDEASKLRELSAMTVKASRGEILCTAKPNAPFAIALTSSGRTGSIDWLSLRYDPLHPETIDIDGKAIPLPSSGRKELEFHFYVDCSVIEAFVNGTASFTKRFYDPGGEAPDIHVKIAEGIPNLSSMTVWQLAPISADRLTT